MYCQPLNIFSSAILLRLRKGVFVFSVPVCKMRKERDFKEQPLEDKGQKKKEEKQMKRGNRKQVLLAGALCAALLAGCSGGGPSQTETAQEQEMTEQTGGQEETAEEETMSQETTKQEKNYDTGDVSLDNPRNQDGIGENELLVVSFGTSFNDSRVEDIKAVEDALQEAYPDWSVRRAFTAQIIINHIQARDGEAIDNMEQALERAAANGVQNLVIQPTHLMHGAEYDELVDAVEEYQDQFASVAVAEPLLGEVGSDATVINEDKQAVAEALTAAAVAEAGYDSTEAAAEDGTAFVFLGHGTSHTANVSYSQMQTQMTELGYDNVFVGTVEGEPEGTDCESIISAVSEAGYTKVVLRPLMVVAGDHANNDMAGEDADSWLSMFTASGSFESVDTQIEGLGRIEAIQDIYVAHTAAAMGE